MDDAYCLLHGDCRERLQSLHDNSIDAIVTDPPYGLAFMGKRWDYDVPSADIWRECLRVLKPGGHLLAFAGTRTQHRMACNIEDAGFDIRDMIAWVYGSGFPKSHDVSKAIDKAAGAERGEEQPHPTNQCKGGQWCKCQTLDATGRYSPTKHPAITAPATDAARQWDGWGTALKPAMEPITVARKPLCGTVAENVLRHGTGGINVDGCRVGVDGGTAKGNPPKAESNGIYGHGINGACDILDIGKGRWPANVIHDGSNEVVGLFPNVKAGVAVNRNRPVDGSTYAASSYQIRMKRGLDMGYGDSGSAARFFYCAKASKRDRGEGNRHPTVKPTDLMRYLCRLVTPPGGTVLDPFMGSGSTGKAAMLEGFRFIGIEREAEYVEIAKARIQAIS